MKNSINANVGVAIVAYSLMGLAVTALVSTVSIPSAIVVGVASVAVAVSSVVKRAAVDDQAITEGDSINLTVRTLWIETLRFGVLIPFVLMTGLPFAIIPAAFCVSAIGTVAYRIWLLSDSA